MNSQGCIDVSTTAFLLCDMQEKFATAIDSFSSVATVASRLAAASKILTIPLIVTEQYPKGLGPTVSMIDVSHALLKAEKTKFSMLADEVAAKMLAMNLSSVVLFGIEAHVC